MNKQELLEALQALLNNSYDDYAEGAIKEAIELAEQLDEPKKPVIPQFVADWIAANRNEEYLIYSVCVEIQYNNGHVPENVRKWANTPGNLFKLSNALQHGYEVEQPRWVISRKFPQQNYPQYFARFADDRLSWKRRQIKNILDERIGRND